MYWGAETCLPTPAPDIRGASGASPGEQVKHEPRSQQQQQLELGGGLFLSPCACQYCSSNKPLNKAAVNCRPGQVPLPCVFSTQLRESDTKSQHPSGTRLAHRQPTPSFSTEAWLSHARASKRALKCSTRWRVQPGALPAGSTISLPSCERQSSLFVPRPCKCKSCDSRECWARSPLWVPMS